MKEVIKMLKWLKENGKDNGEPIRESDMTYFIRLAEQYFEMSLEGKMEDK